MKKFEVSTTLKFNNFMEYINNDLYDYVAKNLDFKAFDVTIEEHKIKRTNLQNDYYWANASDIVKLLTKNNCKIIKMGVECKWTRYDVDEVNKTQFGTDSTAKLSTKEFGDLMETVFAFWIERTKGEWKPKESEEKKAFDEYYKLKE